MRFYQEQQYEMIRRTTEFLKKNTKKLGTTVPAYKESIPFIIAKQKELQDLKQGIKNAVTLKTLEKRDVRKLLIDSILKLLAAIEADQSEEFLDNSNTEKMHTSRSLQRATAQNLSQIANQTIQSAKKIKNIQQYGLFPGDISEALEYLQEFSKIKEAPLKRKTEVAEQNKEIAAVIKYCIKFFEKKIDPLMRIIAVNDKEFVVRYKAFRKVLGRGQGRISDREENYRKSRNKKRKAV